MPARGLPHRFDALLKLERSVSHEGLVSLGGNYYSKPDRTRRVVEVHYLPDEIRILHGTASSHPIQSSKDGGDIGSIRLIVRARLGVRPCG